ncbi:MAG: carbohydrate kinase family protein [Candidatus Bathyarchaeota archaeon]|nr:MAG: carbohydrate kinase family protein [Candidatus Bathyarchaeota archaeon]
MDTHQKTTVVFMGHVSVDKVESLIGSRTQPGGGALYSAIAAKALNVKTALVSAIGEDFKFTHCFNGIDSSCVKTYNMPTTKFHIRYNKDWEAHYLKTSTGAGAKITSSLLPSGLLQSSALVHLSPMSPTKVAKIMSDIKQREPNIEMSFSTWIEYIKKARHIRTLSQLASQADYFMLNEFELKALTKTNYLPLALERIKAKRFVVTLGRFGAVLGGRDREPQMIPAMAVPTKKVIDTTGAGDVWNGAFLATHKTTKNLLQSVAIASVLSSIKCSKWGFKALQNLTFKRPSDLVEHVLALKDGNIQRRISDKTYY